MGLFKDSIITSSASGDANVAATLASISIPGGAVSLGDGMRIKGRFSGVGASASFDLKLGNVVLDTFIVNSGQNADFEAVVWRKGSTQGSWQFNGTGDEEASSSFSWTSAQNLQVIGTSPGESGALLQWLFIER